MNEESGFSVSKPVKFWNKSINADFKELFKSLGKAGIDGVLGNWAEVAKGFLEATAALGLADKLEEIAWLLIYRSLTQALFDLVEGNKELLIQQPNPSDFELLCDTLNETLESKEVRIDQQFFSNPKNLSIIQYIQTALIDWLKYFIVNENQATTISYRLPTYFIFSLHKEWSKHPDKYACLKEEINTPFTKAAEKEQAWQLYLAWLQKQVEEPIFDEAFGLKQVYVPLRAYYQRRIEAKRDDDLASRDRDDHNYERIVIDLEHELTTWLEKTDYDDAIRVISGGPGSGKSSFAKIFAANQAEKEQPVLFVPLHQFEPSDDLVDAVGKFVRDDGFLRYNPLEKDKSEPELLIIFDGLDELAMQGKIASETAQQFIREVQRKVERFNDRGETRLKVLISGRELVIQTNSSDFRKPQQILHILPYFVNEQERNNYIDKQNLLEKDQRQDWWQKYGMASGRQYSGLPEELNKTNLTEITTQPLLNYLVALSYVRGRVDFSQEDSNLNLIYEDLLKAVYERGWERHKHRTLQGIEEKDFIRILEEIALASWHGNGRTTTVREIETHCNSGGLKNLLENFQEGAKLGVTRLLAAFYFRQSGTNIQGDKTFEFTHKSFGEYLTAKRIVREVKLIHKKLEDRKYDPDEGWDDKDALTRWAILCGASPMDEYIFKFILDEVRLQNISDVGRWQENLSHLIGVMLRHGMPMERLSPRPDFQEENQQARNAEEALLVVLNACARVTEKVSTIKWDFTDTFGTWISKIQGQRIGPENALIMSCLSFLNLSECILHIKDFYRANLENTNCCNTGLVFANFCFAKLRKINLQKADIQEANLQRANLQEANLQRANLQGANLQRANLQDANLQGANLQWANLQGANLQGANLKETILEGKDLTHLTHDKDSDSSDSNSQP
ncbi:hypothetical protein NSMS1_37980 [Nostoc sp. MS1]|nr:pentapeptide repeat-containing protein [Nostoc sp. MS1]BCL37351.1 hypothetical protein NSMS1_37980 [Nostoc sp. MS1]